VGEGQRGHWVGGDEEAVAGEGSGARHEGGEGAVGYEGLEVETERGGLSYDWPTLRYGEARYNKLQAVRPLNPPQSLRKYHLPP
jgi:hypothetical protein